MSVTTTKRAVKRTEKKQANPLRVWWIPQVPMTPFLVDVASLEEARLLVEVLANYDAFQFENKIKPDYCNVGGLQVFESGEWSDWYDDETGDSFDDWCENNPRAKGQS